MRGVEERADRPCALLAQRSHGVEHALVLGHDVAHPAERLVVEHLRGPLEVVDAQVAQRVDAQRPRAGLA